MSLRGRRVGRQLKAGADAVLGGLAVGMLRTLRATDRRRMADFAGGFMRTLGPRLKEHRIGRANLASAFPDKPADEIEEILRGAWDNLGRVAAEFAHIDRLQFFEPPKQADGDIVYSPETDEGFQRLRRDGKPALIFAAHLGNWELPALIATKFELDTTVLYRRPNISAASDAIIQIRKGSMGQLVPTGLDAPFKLMRILEGGGHVAMLVDQHYVERSRCLILWPALQGQPVHRPACAPYRVSDTRYARGTPARRTSFSRRLSTAIEPRRAADGKIDVQGTMQAITSVVEGWVREHPDQWLWVHRRWR